MKQMGILTTLKIQMAASFRVFLFDSVNPIMSISLYRVVDNKRRIHPILKLNILGATLKYKFNIDEISCY